MTWEWVLLILATLLITLIFAILAIVVIVFKEQIKEGFGD